MMKLEEVFLSSPHYTNATVLVVTESVRSPFAFLPVVHDDINIHILTKRISGFGCFGRTGQRQVFRHDY